MRSWMRLALILASVFSMRLHADCASPSGVLRQIIYSSAFSTYQFCDGTYWWSMRSGGTGVTTQSAPGSANDILFNSGGTLTGAGNLNWTDSTTRLGIGTSGPLFTVHTMGDVKLGNSSATCSATTAGAMRYNSTYKSIQFCNGTSWSSNFSGTAITLKSVQVITATGTWTKPAGITKIELYLVGGGGGGHARNMANGLGGGAGGTCYKFIDVSGTSSVSVTIGAGGTGASVGGTGGSGGQSKWGGGGSAPTANAGTGASGSTVGDGGTASNCDIAIMGDESWESGGSSTHGGGGNCPAHGTGQNGGGFGSGGGGGNCEGDSATGTGGNGASGAAIVWEYGP